MNIHILVLVIAIALFGVLAFKQMSALILAPLVTIFDPAPPHGVRWRR